jgi:hypothetical protein
MALLKKIIKKNTTHSKMGAYLDKPIKEKNPTHGKTDMCTWGACSMQGWRCS